MKEAHIHLCRTAAIALLSGLAGLRICTMNLQDVHAADRAFVVTLWSLIFATIGALAGYVFSLLLRNRFHWLESLLALSIPALAGWAFFELKSGHRNAAVISATVAGGFILVLIARARVQRKTDKQKDPNAERSQRRITTQ